MNGSVLHVLQNSRGSSVNLSLQRRFLEQQGRATNLTQQGFDIVRQFNLEFKTIMLQRIVDLMVVELLADYNHVVRHKNP